MPRLSLPARHPRQRHTGTNARLVASPGYSDRDSGNGFSASHISGQQGQASASPGSLHRSCIGAGPKRPYSIPRAKSQSGAEITTIAKPVRLLNEVDTLKRRLRRYQCLRPNRRSTILSSGAVKIQRMLKHFGQITETKGLSNEVFDRSGPCRGGYFAAVRAGDDHRCVGNETVSFFIDL